MRKDKIKSGLGEEFKKFILRGNVVDMAVGVIVGGAFASITSSLVNDVFMPFVGMFIGGVDFSKLNIKLPVLFPGNEPGTLNLGTFITTVINFILIAFVIFAVVKGINKVRERADEKKKKDETPAAPPAPLEPSAEEKLLTEIRDLLKNKK